MKIFQVQFEENEVVFPAIFSTELKAKRFARKMLAENGTQIIAKDLDGYSFGLLYSELINGKWTNNQLVR